MRQHSKNRNVRPLITVRSGFCGILTLCLWMFGDKRRQALSQSIAVQLERLRILLGRLILHHQRSRFEDAEYQDEQQMHELCPSAS
jgi:hypothetical protein